MPLPAQIELVEEAFTVLEDRYVSQQELNQFMFTVVAAAVMMMLGSIFWEELTESYEESVGEIGL